LREHLTLLSPQQIREALRTLGLKQKDLGERIGVAPETISRWISGTNIQSRAMDNLMRLFFALDNVRSALSASVPNANLGVIELSPLDPCATHVADTRSEGIILSSMQESISPREATSVAGP
jgi:transcriptional regulator with XRE-family HTH domain